MCLRGREYTGYWERMERERVCVCVKEIYTIYGILGENGERECVCELKRYRDIPDTGREWHLSARD